MGAGTILVWLAFQAAAGSAIADYVPSAVGDTWRYRNLAPGGTFPVLVRMAGIAAHRGLTVLRREESKGAYRYETVDPEKGLQILLVQIDPEHVIEYERPVTLLPAKLNVGDHHRSQSRYVYRERDVKKDVGLQTYEVEVEARESVHTPAGDFADCLVIRTRALRMDFSGTQEGYELKEWYAQNVGPVKVEGELFWRDESGATTRAVRVDAELESAVLGGRAVGR